jgi:hypothetical protein
MVALFSELCGVCKMGMAVGIDEAQIMKVTRLRTARGEWNGVGNFGRSFWRKPTGNLKKRSEVCFCWGGFERSREVKE